MPRKARAVTGIRRRLKDWKAAASALLETTKDAPDAPLPPISRRVALLKALVGTDGEWKAKVKAFFADLDRNAAKGELDSLSLQPVTPPAAPEAPAAPQNRRRAYIAAVVAVLDTPHEKDRLPEIDLEYSDVTPPLTVWELTRAHEIKRDGHSSLTEGEAYRLGLAEANEVTHA